ncbi:hypothetical protein [Caballeronia sp. AZ1_KS37]|uniref:hypothetical protein n=1 Tax=Caballeronia sp. AZ1_KS37 TaxID=2921756 RepID=UPI0020298E0D|nr:hypothetical protein [Caballeronia sp. AZ1_KS37]
MSGSSGGGSQTTTQELPDWAQGTAKDILTQGTALSKQTAPVYTGSTVAGLTSDQLNAIANGTTASNNATAASNLANSYASSLAGSNPYTVSSGYTGNVTADSSLDPYTSVDNNPYLASTVAASNKAISDAYMNGTAANTATQFRNSGAFGGSANQQAVDANQTALGTALSNNTSAMYNAAYNTAEQAAAQKSAQANTVALANQSVGTSANTAANSTNANSYYSNLSAQLAALQGASSSANAASSSANAANTLGITQQTTNQNQLLADYKTWLAQQPYEVQQQSINTLSSSLSAALGAGTQGTSTTTASGTNGNTLATLLGLGVTGAGLYAASA